MKKNYILPEAELVNITSADIIAASPIGIGENENDITVDVSEW